MTRLVMKAFADRERDWLDIETVLIRQGCRLKWRQIRQELEPLCAAKESPDILLRLEVRRRKVAGLG